VVVDVGVDVAATVGRGVSVGGVDIGVARQATVTVMRPRLKITTSNAWTPLCTNKTPILYLLVPRSFLLVLTPGKLGHHELMIRFARVDPT
jgi:hypothetical protein